MFVLKSTYERAVQKAKDAEAKADIFRKEYTKLTKKWNQLVDQINDKGGETFLLKARVIKDPLPTIDDADLRKLLMLCHPDKHDGKPMAVEVTAKLNAIRQIKG